MQTERFRILILLVFSVIAAKHLGAQDASNISAMPRMILFTENTSAAWRPARTSSHFSMFRDQRPVSLNLPAYTKRRFKKPVFANDFILNIYPSAKTRLKFMDRIISPAEQRFKLMPDTSP